MENTLSETRLSPRAATLRGHPFCFRCGYDLFGLELPRPCPECGQMRDPTRDAEEARRWFASLRACWRWFLRPSRNPLGACYVLDDPGSARVARRREFRGLWLPAILSSLVAVGGALTAVEYKAKVWYFEWSDPKRTPLRVFVEDDHDHLIGINLHLFRGGLFFKKPQSWVQVVERTERRFAWHEPDYLDPSVLFLAIAPWFAIMFGFLPARFFVRRLARHGADSSKDHGLVASMRAASSLSAVALGASLWLWCAALVVMPLAEALSPNEARAEALGLGHFLALPIVCVVACVICWPPLVIHERARKVFRHRRLMSLLLIAVTCGGPVLALAVFFAIPNLWFG